MRLRDTIKLRLNARERLRSMSPVIDRLGAPVSAISAIQLKAVRWFGLQSLPITREALFRVGLIPVRDHYYEPFVNRGTAGARLEARRVLPGIAIDRKAQLELLGTFRVQEELNEIPDEKKSHTEYGFSNGTYEWADGCFLYAMIRYLKPRRMVEVGSGNSTLVAAEAIRKNRAEDVAHACQHVCVEPYEMPWLEDRGVEVVRQRVESLDPAFFSLLEAGDILFIDSSHVIRPEGDVLYLFQSILPVLNKGVYVHVHDIFTPYHYPPRWLFEKVLFWNEQYLLESFLAMNRGFSVVAALYDLHRNAFDAFAEAFPPVRRNPSSSPTGFWIQRV